MAFNIIKYSDEWEAKWDKFVMKDSANGTFLQSRKFINYHPQGRFSDASILVMQGTNIVAVIPACDTVENGKRCFRCVYKSEF